jgi:hypothetical protein
MNMEVFACSEANKTDRIYGTLIPSVCTNATRKEQAALPERRQARRLFLFVPARVAM